MHEAVELLFKKIDSRKISDKAAALRAGLGENTVRNWGCGVSPSIDNLEKALNVFGYTLRAVPLCQD